MRRWLDDDLAVLRDRSLTASQVADQLGRSVSAVEQARIAYAENVPNPGKRRIRQQWSDADLAVALDRSLTMSEAAQQLGRTVGAVRSARALYSHGRIGESDRRRRWTEDDIEVLLDASLSTAEVARQLNRSVGTVYYARRRYGREVPADAHGTLLAWRFHGCACEPCQEFGRQFRERTLDPREDAARSREFSQRMQEITRPTATRHGAPWTPEEADIVCNPDIQVVDAALQLGRTAAAVKAARWRFLNPDESRRQRPQGVTPRLSLS
ncbi:helix-turn-helix domain-containing protein [Mycobacteroides abscessus]|uniref:helix-turn-helix domain-containing protein n=1 Tax=Mycobacteroides abscessus TaxID=36809 RepID=UPI000C258DAC|nr:helix-turn-helix domain-containing protein [Mycobacteroides abscessus]MDO3202135.1 helix-turn-helix domain-containing protein [Mycobacteroides abscessus subsp. abscessus]